MTICDASVIGVEVEKEEIKIHLDEERIEVTAEILKERIKSKFNSVFQIDVF